eukprot:5513413-Pleurochrysis_carterae.AAC.1
MEDLYSRQPYRATCASANMSLAFEWKSFMLSSRDEVFRQRVLAAAADGTPVTVVMNAGARRTRQKDPVNRDGLAGPLMRVGWAVVVIMMSLVIAFCGQRGRGYGWR